MLEIHKKENKSLLFSQSLSHICAIPANTISRSLGIILFLILHFKYYWNLNNKDGGFLKVKKKKTRK